MNKLRYFLDTNVFDYILDYNVELTRLLKIGIFYTSNVQYSELQNVKNEHRRHNLMKLYNCLPQKKLLLESGIWLDELHWDEEQIWIDEIGDTVISLTKNNINKPWKDSLIAEIAKNNQLIIVTNDKGFQVKAKGINIQALSVVEFMDLLAKVE